MMRMPASRRDVAYSHVCMCATLFALSLVGIMISAVGDKQQTMNVEVWFAPYILLLPVLVCEINLYNITTDEVAYGVHVLVKLVGLVLALLQSIGFLIWGAILWSRQTNIGAHPFYPTIVSLMAFQILVLAVGLVVLIRLKF